MSIKARTIQSGRIAILELRGSLVDDGETGELKDVVADFIEQGNKCMVINMARVNYLQSAGVGALIAAHTSYVRNGGMVRLAGLTQTVHNLLVITKLIDVFDVFDTVDQAVESFEQKTITP